MSAGAEKPRLAVIGSGIAGLSSAWLLKQKYQVTLLESHERVGMGVYTIDYDADGIRNRIDIPLRVFCEGYYPNLMALYRYIGVEVELGDHSGVFLDASGNEILHYGNIQFAGRHISYPKLRSLFRPKAWQLILQYKKFTRLAQRALRQSSDIRQQTLGQFLAQHQVSEDFTETVLLPVLSVTCTCDYQSLLNYPAEIILVYLTSGIWKFGITNARKGVDDIVPRLTDGIQVQTGKRVKTVRCAEQGIEVHSADGDVQVFDQVVIASQAQQAASMLQGFEQQKQLLNTVAFERSDMMIHTDSSFLPQQGTGFSAVSYCLPKQGQQRPQVSVDLTKAIDKYRQQSTIFQTWHPAFEPDDDKLLARIEFTRPVVTLESREAMQQLRQSQQNNPTGVWFCGSYLADKIPLLDAAVDSSVSIAQALGVDIPWHSA